MKSMIEQYPFSEQYEDCNCENDDIDSLELNDDADCTFSDDALFSEEEDEMADSLYEYAPFSDALPAESQDQVLIFFF